MRKYMAIALSSLAWFGCEVEPSPSLVIASFHGLNATNGGCSFETAAAGSGTYDAALGAALTHPFHIYLQLQNHLEPREDRAAGETERQRITLESVDVTFEGESWDSLPGPIRVPVTGVLISPAGLAYAPVPIIPPSIATLLATQAPLTQGAPLVPLRLRVQAHGRSDDGTRHHSNELVHGIYVCNDCLASSCGAIGKLWAPMCGAAGAQPDGGECIEPPDVD